MGKIVKFAISMPAEDFNDVESIRRMTGQTRSHFILEAIRHWNPRAEKAHTVKEESIGLEASGLKDLAGIAERRQRAIEAAGKFRSGVADLSKRHDHYLADAFGRNGDGDGGVLEDQDEHLHRHDRSGRHP